ncbi:MAG: EamA family transporter [Polaribacter sp.]|jgi:drug/metabolite transporter (DMT)-like permease|nr:EamA family transporter [Polaribacter sp.]MDG1953705.1 EamA family transporter [Polaribacter sp.]
MKFSKETILIVLAFFAIYVIWGSTYLLNKIAVQEISPLFLSATRFTFAGFLILVIAKFLKLPLKITRKQLLNNTLAGFLFLVYGNGVFVWALQYVDSGFAALEASSMPLVVLILMRIIYGQKIHKMSLFGVALGITGIFLLVSQQEITKGENSLLGVFMIATCILSWASASIFVSKADMHKSYFVNSGYQMFVAGVLLFLFSLIVGEEWKSPLLWNNETSISMLLLVIFGSIIAFTAFNFLLKKVSPEKVATSAYVNPIIALLLGWYILGEQISFQSIIAALVLLLGVYFINSNKNSKKT